MTAAAVFVRIVVRDIVLVVVRGIVLIVVHAIVLDDPHATPPQLLPDLVAGEGTPRRSARLAARPGRCGPGALTRRVRGQRGEGLRRKGLMDVELEAKRGFEVG